MSNIDKNIERCKELIKTEHANWIGLTNQDAISGVLSELEKYKKIAEKLADELRLTVNINKVCGTLDVAKKRCHKEDISCKQCAIDWARNEVENGTNN